MRLIAWIIPLVMSWFGAVRLVGASPRAIRRYWPSTRPSSETFVKTLPQSTTMIELADAGLRLLAGFCPSPNLVSVYIASILFPQNGCERIGKCAPQG